jgi:hypothetical protein
MSGAARTTTTTTTAIIILLQSSKIKTLLSIEPKYIELTVEEI